MTEPNLLLRHASESDRAQWREADVAQVAPADLACVSLDRSDAFARVAALRREGCRILALATRAQIAARRSAIDAGVSELLTTAPIATAEAEARLRLLATGSALPADAALVHGTILRIAGRDHPLNPREARLVAALFAARGGLVRHDALLRAAWDDADRDPQNVRVAINRMRKRIEPDPAFPRYLLTEPALGYRLGTGQPTYPPGYMS